MKLRVTDLVGVAALGAVVGVAALVGAKPVLQAAAVIYWLAVLVVLAFWWELSSADTDDDTRANGDSHGTRHHGLLDECLTVRQASTADMQLENERPPAGGHTPSETA